MVRSTPTCSAWPHSLIRRRPCSSRPANGRRSSSRARRRQLAAEFIFTDSPRIADARPIANFARDLFLQGEVDEVKVVATLFINTLTQKASAVEFLPIGEIKGLKIPGRNPKRTLASDVTEVLFEPSPQAVLAYLLGHYLNIFIYRVLLEAKASEQSARMVAMKNATENASGLIGDLTLEYNKLRQGNITKELLELAGGQIGND